MTPHSYVCRFDNQCQVVIPGHLHGFPHLQEHDISCMSPDYPDLALLPNLITIDPTSQDVCLYFVTPQTGSCTIAPHR